MKYGYIAKVIEYIEENLASGLNPENLALRHFASVSSLYRDFCACTGHSVKEYVRRRRISNACALVKSSGLSLAVIADGCGCRTQQSFNKQFKSVVGMTPSEYRQNDMYFYFPPFAEGNQGFSVKVSAEVLPECETVRFYDSRLTGIEDRAVASLGPAVGRVFGRNGEQAGNRFCYELMMEISPGWEARTYASCVVRYNEKSIGGGWNYLYNTWLPESMFEKTEEAYFEEFLLKSGKPDRLRLYLPVRKRKTARHISVSDIPEMFFIVAKERGADAERRASERVTAFLRERYPLLLRNARRFYVRAYDDTCECGIECGDGFRLPAGDIEVLPVPPGIYAVLPCECPGDPGTGGAKLEKWLKNNSVPHGAEPVFALYETPAGTSGGANIVMKLYKRLEIDRNG